MATAEDPMEVGFLDTTTEATIIPEDITGVTIDTIIEAMPHTEQPSGFSLAGWLLEVCIVHSGGLIMPYRYLQPIMTHTTIFRTLPLHMWFRFPHLRLRLHMNLRLRPAINNPLLRQCRQINATRPKLTKTEI